MQPTTLEEITVAFITQIAVILIAAVLGGIAIQRVLHLPPVVGELLAGVAVGPFALGGLVLAGHGPLFPLPETAGELPVSGEIWAVAQLGAVVLLFSIGLETDFGQFLRYSRPALAVAIGGVVLPFILGNAATVMLGATGPLDPPALFMGAVLTATSISVTARVLADLGLLNSPEGTVVLGAAVIDDVLGILVLTVVVQSGTGGPTSAWDIGLLAVKALGFWIVLLSVGLALVPWLTRGMNWLGDLGVASVVALGLGLGAAALAERFGLAQIIGAYTMGLALSRSTLADELSRRMDGAVLLLAPIFFAVMGMLVDLRAVVPVLGIGLALSGLAILGKLLGAGLPALALGFGLPISTRIGLGMTPRGEVALIIAGVGLGAGVIGLELFGVAILVMLVTTVAAPVALAAVAGWGR